MSQSRGLSRGDRRRNEQLKRLRSIVSRERAVLAVDLASDKQVFVLTDHDSTVLARKTFRCSPWKLDAAISWGATQAAAAGHRGIVLACEPTGNRWLIVAELAVAAGVELVCVQPMLVARAREAEDFTRDKSDDKDALIIARLTTQLHVYLPECPDQRWARLRHLGRRRVQQIVAETAARQQVRDLLEYVWPAGLRAAADPMRAKTWLAAMSVVGCDPAAVRGYGTGAAGRAAFGRAVSAEIGQWGATRVCWRIIDALIAAADDSHAVAAHRAGALERAAFALGDLRLARAGRAEADTRMRTVIDELGYTELIDTIPGVSVISAAAILAETGDLTRFDSARALVKHAGLCPRENSSGRYRGTTTISGRGRPLLRVATWRAVWGALGHNEILTARHHHLTHRDHNKLADNQARVAVAGSLLRQLHAVLTTRTPWDPTIAAGGLTHTRQEAA
ncbi:IS110 family transposase [Gordonia sp. LSe1-13]|uniref:IS110 family transposase n=1 Tax=Gordonia sesuvii TaxID=3116777 RepID=A0ABU7MER5_9ACTN|nr:IS110 family transposase [Gordonia sp. LSe1-13]